MVRSTSARVDARGRRGGFRARRVFRCAFSLLVALGPLACATAGASWAPPTGDPASSTGDALLAAGAHAEAIAAYDRDLERTSAPEERARLRFFRALARLSDGHARGEEQALAELRAVELEHGALLWGRAARIIVLELTRRDALREAVMQAGAELAETEHQARLLRHRLLTSQALVEEQERALASTEEERKKLRRQLDGVNEQARAQSERIQELERELEALKQIDMGRKP
jgi:chromosome segregation ATPase